MAWSKKQQVVLAILPKISSVFSLAGSLWIAIEVLTDTSGKLPKRRHPYHRLLFAMSIYDILESVWNFMSTWPIPEGTQNVYNPMGTAATCTAQGFFLTLSVAVPIYNAFLSLYYMLVINYQFTDVQIKRYIEPAMHLFAFGWAFFTAFYSAITGLINNANLWCWIAPLPTDCKDTFRFGAEESNCKRGDNAWIYRWAFYFAPLWFCIFFATVCTLAVYKKVRQLDRLVSRRGRVGDPSQRGFRLNSVNDMSFAATTRPRTINENEEGVDENENTSAAEFRVSTSGPFIVVPAQTNENKTREVFAQAVCYLGVFYATHVWSTTNRIMQQIHQGGTYFGLIMLHSFFDPWQGFLNFFVYQRPRYLRIVKEEPNISYFGALRKMLTFSFQYNNNASQRRQQSQRSTRSNNNNNIIDVPCLENSESDDSTAKVDSIIPEKEVEMSKSLNEKEETEK